MASVRNRIRLRYETNEPPRQRGLTKSVLLGIPLAGGRVFFFLVANAFVSRSDGDVTQLPRGQTREMVLFLGATPLSV